MNVSGIDCGDWLTHVEVQEAECWDCGAHSRILGFSAFESSRRGVLRDVGEVDRFSDIAADAGSRRRWMLLASRPR